MRALYDWLLVGHGGDWRAEYWMDEGRRGRAGLYEGGWGNVDGPAAIERGGVDRERDSPQRRRLQLDGLYGTEQRSHRRREGRYVCGAAVVADGASCSRARLSAVEDRLAVEGGRGKVGRTGGHVRSFEPRHGGGGALERAADLRR